MSSGTVQGGSSVGRDNNSKLQIYFVETLFAGSSSGDMETNFVRRIRQLAGEVSARVKSIIVSAGGKN